MDSQADGKNTNSASCGSGGYTSTVELGSGVLRPSNNSVSKRPVLLWLICIFYVVSFFWTVLSYYLVLTESIPVSIEMKVYMRSLGLFSWTLTALNAILSGAAAILLFLLKKQCVSLFAATLVLGISGILWNIFGNDGLWLKAMPRGGGAGAFLGMAILISVLLYSRHLVKRGLLT